MSLFEPRPGLSLAWSCMSCPLFFFFFFLASMDVREACRNLKGIYLYARAIHMHDCIVPREPGVPYANVREVDEKEVWVYGFMQSSVLLDPCSDMDSTNRV